MPAFVTALDDSFKKHFRISEVHWTKDNGGQKVVYCVTRDGNKCILKIYRNFNARDVRELEIYKKFRDLPGIPKTIETGKFERDTYSFEAFIDGVCLDAMVERYKTREAEVADLLLGVCQIMKPLWESEEQIVHRDIKPSNIIVTPDGSPAVIDFGIAKDISATTVTYTGFQPNSWPFASPEQFYGNRDQIHYRTDFFCLGALGYYLYHGSLPFGNTLEVIEQNFRDRTYTIPNQEGKLGTFFSETLRVTIAERPRTVEDMINLLLI